MFRHALPERARRGLRSVRGRWDKDDPFFDKQAVKGPEADAYERIRQIPGWAGYDDLVAYTLILRTQTAAGLRGDILEIGSYLGRSAAMLVSQLVANERAVLCDAFDLVPAEGTYPTLPTPEVLRSHLAMVVPDAPLDRVDIIKALSRELDFCGRQFRFIHVDGAHDYKTALADLHMAEHLLLPGGIIAVDDNACFVWPEVERAVTDFLVDTPGVRSVADVNRFGDSGRKLYLARR